MKQNFQNFSSTIPGIIMYYAGVTSPTGWLLCDGKSIGKTGSIATARANDDTRNLFELMWNNMSNSQASVLPFRGASASADFLNGHVIALPSLKGRAIVTKDNMGALGDANRVSISGFDGKILGNTGGSQTVALNNTNQLPNHTHSSSLPSQSLAHTHFVGPYNQDGANNYSATPPSYLSQGETGATSYNHPMSNVSLNHSHDVTYGANGSSSAHLNLQPTVVMNIIIQL